MRFLLLFGLWLPCWVLAQSPKIDSLRRVIETTQVDTLKGLAHVVLGWHLMTSGRLDESIQVAKAGLHICLAARFERGIGSCYNTMASANHQKGNFNQALKYYFQALKAWKSIEERKGIAIIYNNIALAYLDLKDLETALNYLHQSYKLRSELKDTLGMAQCRNNLGSTYDELKQFERAIDQYSQSLALHQKLKNRNATAGTLTNLGVAYLKLGVYDSAQTYFSRSLSLNQELIADLGPDHLGIATNLLNFSFLYRLLGKPQLACSYAQQGLVLVHKHGGHEYFQSAYLALYQADSALGNWKSAFEHLRLFKLYSDSLKNDEQSKELGHIESEYEFEQAAEAEKRQAEAAARLEAERTERRNNLQYLSIFAALMGLFGGLVLLRRVRVPVRVMEVALFAGLLILFEFLLVLFDPWVDDVSGGIPFYKLTFNTGIAVVFAPLHQLGLHRLRQRLLARPSPSDPPLRPEPEAASPPESTDLAPSDPPTDLPS